MNLDSGVLTVWRGTNTAPAGTKPELSYVPLWESCYGEKTVGVTRWYTARQHGDRPDCVVQVPRTYELRTGDDLVTLSPFTHRDGGGAYKLVQIQQVTDEDGLPMTDLTLERNDGIDAGTLTGRAGGAH